MYLSFCHILHTQSALIFHKFVLNHQNELRNGTTQIIILSITISVFTVANRKLSFKTSDFLRAD